MVAVSSPGINVRVGVEGAIVEVPNGVKVCAGVFDKVGVAVNVAVCVNVGVRVGDNVGEGLGCDVSEGSAVSVDVGDGEFSTIGIGLDGRAVTTEGREIA